MSQCICSDGKPRCDCGLCATPLTIVNSGQHMKWFPRRMDGLALAHADGAAQEGGTFRAPAPARIPRKRPFFKTDAEMRAEGWEPASWRETLMVLGVPAAILLIAVGLWAFMTWVK